MDDLIARLEEGLEVVDIFRNIHRRRLGQHALFGIGGIDGVGIDVYAVQIAVFALQNMQGDKVYILLFEQFLAEITGAVGTKNDIFCQAYLPFVR